MAIPTFQMFHTSRYGDGQFDLFLCPEGNYMAAIFERGAPFEIYSHSIDEPWNSVAVPRQRNGEDYGRLKSILWHPFLPRQLLLIYNFVIQNVTFDVGDVEIMDTLNLDPALTSLVNVITNACINDAASEISFFLENSIYTLRDPFSVHEFHGSEYYKPVPDRLHLHTGHESLALWYIADNIIVGVYPLGFFATSTSSPHKLHWQIIVSPARMIYSVCISPDKELSVAVTKDGHADLYCLKEHRLLRTFSTNQALYKTISTAVFSNREAVSFAFLGSSALLIFPNIFKSEVSLITMKQLGPQDQPSATPLGIYGAGMIHGHGYIFTFKGGNAPVCLINVDELCGFEHGLFEIDTTRHWMDTPPDIPLTNLKLSPPVAVGVAIPAIPRLHPIKALARDIILALDWQHLVVAFFVAAGFVTGAANRKV